MNGDHLPDLTSLSPEELGQLERLLLGSQDDGRIEPRRGQRIDAPLSFAQRRLWIIDQLRPGDPAYNLALSFRLRGPLDREALQFSLTELVRRHHILRTTFLTVDDEARQRVAPPCAVPLPTIDLRRLPLDKRHHEAMIVAQTEIDSPFTLDTGPLFRACLVQLDDLDHVLILTMHHIVTDGWSMGIVLKEIAEVYQSRRDGRAPTLAEPRLQYADYAEWQHHQQRRESMRGHLDYWRRELADAPDLQLPCDRVRGRIPSTRGAAETATIERDVLDRLDELARGARATRYMALLSIYALLLSRYARQRDVVIGTSMAGRNRADVEAIVGFFVNVLPVRITIPARLSFRHLLALVRDRVVAAFEREDLPFDALVDALAPGRTFERHPIFQVAFSAQDMLPTGLDLAGLSIEPFHVLPSTTRFDLEFYVLESAHALRIHEVYSVELFDASTARQILRHYESLLRAAIENPDAEVDTLDFLSANERTDLIDRWNDTAVEVGAAATIVDLFYAHVAARPHAPAVVFGAETRSYQDLGAEADRLARRLRLNGVRRGSLVGLCVERSPEMIAAVLGIMKAGAAFVPLDPAHPPERLAEIVHDAQLNAIVTESTLRAVFASFGGAVVDVRHDEGSHGRLPDGAVCDQPLTGSDLAYVIYTSGSTGRPKGTLLEHRGLVNVVSEQMRQFGVGPGDRVLQFASLSFDASVFEIVMALGTGAALVVGRREDLVPGPSLADFIERYQISATVLPPSVLALVPTETLPLLRVLTVAGEACPQELVKHWADGRRFCNLYGPTETTIWATASQPLHPGDAPVIGRPIGNTRIYVLDDRMNPVPVGVAGEMYIGGCGVARGYLHRVRLTAERFVPDPFSAEPGARLYRTGDLVRYRQGGILEFVGRRDHQVKLHGYRIELGEIEAVLSEMPGVETAVVKLWENDGSRRLAAYVKGTPGAAPSINTLRDALRKRLPPYMIPGVFVYLDSLPLTTSGKLNRAALPDPSAGAADQTSRDEILPRNVTESTLARVWAEVLGLPRVAIHDNFFDVGGDSILSIQIASRARAAGVPLAPQHFFEYQTVAEQAAHVEVEMPHAPSTDVATGPAPLTPIQQWFFEQDLTAPGQFAQAVLLEATVPLDVATLRSALVALVAHHDALRSRFRRTESGWIQGIEAQNASIDLSIVDVSDVPDDRRASPLAEACAAVQSTLDIDSGRLIAAAYFDCGRGQPPRVFLAIHHLVVDAVSWRILLEDLESAVNELEAGRTVTLPSKTTSLKRWAEHLHALPASAWFKAQETWWLSACSQPAARMPGDGLVERNQMTYGAAATLTTRFTRDETEALLRLAPRITGARMHEVLFGALVQALGRAGGSPVSVDVEGHGRDADASWNLDVSRTVGWFTAACPVLVDVAPEWSFDETLEASCRALRAVPAGGIGYGLVRYQSSDADVRSRLEAARSEIVFNYLGQLDSTSPMRRVFRLGSDGDLPVCAANQRPYAVEVNARVLDGVLQANWTFDPRRHSRERIGSLVEAFSEHVRACINRAPDRQASLDTTLAALDSGVIQQLLERYRSHGVEDVYPLTPLQHGMIVHSMSAVGSGAFATQIDLVLHRDIDSGRLREAWRLLQREHPVLRTVFVEIAGEFRQVVLSRPDLSWAEHDWSDLPATESARRLESFCVSERAAGFDLEVRPPSRLALIRTDARVSHLVWTHHHALIDGWSGAMLLDELFAAYSALSRGESPAPPERPRFREHVAWLSGRDCEAGRRFWRRLLDGVTSPTRLWADRAPGTRVRSATQIHEQERWVPAALTRSLVEFAASHRLTMSTVVHGAWALLLSRYSGERTVVFGTAVAGRPALPGIERAIGLFMNGLPVPVTVDDDAAVGAWLADLQKRLVRIREREHDALWEIQEWSQAAVGQPLCETTLAFESYPVAPSYAAGAGELGLADFNYVSHTSAALHLRILPGERLRLMLGHDAQRFDDATAAAMLAQLESALRQFVEEPDALLRRMSLRTGAEPDPAQPLPTVWRGAAHTQFSARAAASPDRTAIFENGLDITYGALDARSSSVASALRRAGIGSEDVVGIFAPRGSLLVTGMIGVLKAGAAFTVLDPAYPPHHITRRLEIAGAKAVLHADTADNAPVSLCDWARAQGARVVSLLACVASGHEQNPHAVDVSPDSLAYVAFTSGSTGEPKAVLARHAALAGYAQWLRDAFDVGPEDRFSVLSALSHDPVLRDIFPPLQIGATLCIPGDEIAGTPGALADWVASARVTRMNVTPSMAQVLIEGAADASLPLVRQLFFVGEPLAGSLVRRVQQVAPAAACVNLYGTTETQQALGFCVVDSRVLNAREVVAAGRGMPGVQLIVARDDRQPAAVGEPGEIWVRSPLLARGYGDHDTTPARFAEDAFGPGTGRAYRTGDLGYYLPNGDLVLLGRNDDQIKVRGFRVEPVEIESVLLRHPDAGAVAVVAASGSGADGTLVAYVTGPAEPAELRALMARDLPPHMVPQRIVSLSELPRTASGKIDRRLLAKRELQDAVGGRERIPPQTPTEIALADIWRTLLSAGEICREDSFFELGGHSVAAARLTARLRDRFGVAIRLSDVFEHPRLTMLAAYVDEVLSREDDVLVNELLDEIQALSPEEVEAILGEGGAPGTSPV